MTTPLPRHELSRLEAVAAKDRPVEELVARRAAGEPLQYIEGTAVFGPVELVVDPRVMVPRPETETLFEMAVGIVGHPQVIVDLCTGSGALALALKHVFADARVLATDVSQDALDVAAENRNRTGLDITLVRGHLFDPLPRDLLGRVDLLVANPPYVAESEYPALPPDVRREPREALVAGPSGLEVIEEIGAGVADWLAPGGVVICEIAETQGEAAAKVFSGLSTEVRQDLTGRDRFVVGVEP